MIQIDKSNFKDFAPDELAGMVSSGKAQIIEAGIEAAVEIIHYFCQALGERKKLRARVELLEVAFTEQKKINEQIISLLNSKTEPK